MIFFPALKRQREVDLCEIQDSQGYVETLCQKEDDDEDDDDGDGGGGR